MSWPSQYRGGWAHATSGAVCLCSIRVGARRAHTASSLDTQNCKFRVGSYSYDSSKLIFNTNSFGYSSKETNSMALDYDIRK